MARTTTKARLQEVAEAAGVSMATVSRALSKPEMVTPKLRERIWQICTELNYTPNRVARSLNMDRTETIGLIVPTISNPLYASTVDGVRDVLDSAGYGLFVSSSERNPQKELDQIRAMIGHNVDAIISMMPMHRPELHSLLERSGIPFIFVTPAGDEKPTPHIGFDNAAAMEKLTEFVLSRGHRQIALLSGMRDSTPVIAERFDAAMSVLRKNGCLPPPHWIVECDFEPPAARAGARAILNSPQRPTAVLCSGDQHAVACITEAGRLNIRMPDELSVTGFNDVSIAQLCEPRLTTVRPPYREIGMEACRLMLAALTGADVPASTILHSKLIIRSSVSDLNV